MEIRNVGLSISPQFIRSLIQNRSYRNPILNITRCVYCFCPKIFSHICLIDHGSGHFLQGSIFPLYNSILYLAGQIMELRESDDFWQAVLDLGENTGSVQELINLTENLDCFDYLPGVRNDYDLGYYWIEESGCYDTSNLGALANYIDYEDFGRDIRYEEGGVFGDNGYVRSNGGRFVDIYDGDIENIPEEYRISSPAVPVRSAAPRQAEQPER